MSEDWVEVAGSDEVPAGRAVPVDVGDVELVVWRGHDGVACVMDARCPHLWSHLGVEGVVDGDELVCAAHFWRFDRDGSGSKVGMTGRRDPKACAVVFPVREEDGVIRARLSGEGAA